MNVAKTIHIADTIHGSIKLNCLEKQVISTQIFNRLHNISQNSTVYLTFPTNRTKRFEHSIGTMSLCGKMFQDAIANADSGTLENFFKSIENIIDDEIANKLASYAVKYRSKIGDKNLSESKIAAYKSFVISSEYNSFIPVNVDSRYRNIYVILFQALRLSALMHDVGHPPFSHITENALKEIWNKISQINCTDRNERQKKYISSMKQYFELDQDLHEQIGNIITGKVLDDIIDNIAREDQDNSSLFEQQLFKIFVCEVTSAILQEKKKIFGELHRIIDGTLDGDRLDYVSRDPINSGLNVGVIEYDRIIISMRLTKVGEDFLFSPSSKVIEAIEDFFNRRWRMYKQIIYHHRVIKTDYLLQSCIEDLALNYLEQNEPEEECGNILPYDISGLWKAIKDRPSHQAFFDSLIQWDDSWLMTVMKKHYFNMYTKLPKTKTLYKLEELLANKKNYFSLIKRMEDFVVIDNQIAKVMLKEYDDIQNLIEGIKSSHSDKDGKIVVEIDPLLNYIIKLGDTIKKYSNDQSYLPQEGFILAKIKKIFDNLFEDGWLYKTILESIDKLKSSGNDNIKDTIVIMKKVKTGVQGGKNWAQGGLGLYTVRDETLDVMSFSKLSNTGNILTADINFLPVFYLYILKEKHYLNFDEFKSLIGATIGEEIAKKIKTKLLELK